MTSRSKYPIFGLKVMKCPTYLRAGNVRDINWQANFEMKWVGRKANLHWTQHFQSKFSDTGFRTSFQLTSGKQQLKSDFFIVIDSTEKPFSLTWTAVTQIFWSKESVSTPVRLVWGINMTAVSMFWDRNITSSEITLLTKLAVILIPMLSSALVQASTGFKKDALGKLILCYRLGNESTLKTNSTKIIFNCSYCTNNKNIQALRLTIV